MPDPAARTGPSGAKKDRPQLKAALDYLREDDTHVVWKLSRLARSLKQVIQTAQDMQSSDIDPKVLTQNIDTGTPEGRLFFHMTAAFDQIQRELIVATIGDPKHFTSGRQFAAWLGITPREDSTGGKARPGKISKRGDSYLRCLLVHGARSVVQAHRRKATETSSSSWLGQLLARRHANVATVAMANRNARIAWALMVHGTVYQPRA